MIYVFDLDYTLFDTNSFIKRIAQNLGLSIKEFNASYRIYFTERGNNYNAYKHINFLVQEGEVKQPDSQKVKSKIVKILQGANSYVFLEGEEVLKKIKQKGHLLYLISLGDPVWQKLKISKLSIKKYFSKIIITNKKKSTALDFLKKVKGVKVIVNDNAQESFLIKKALGQAKIILVKGPYSYNIKHKLKVYTLPELLSILRD